MSTGSASLARITNFRLIMSTVNEAPKFSRSWSTHPYSASEALDKARKKKMPWVTDDHCHSGSVCDKRIRRLKKRRKDDHVAVQNCSKVNQEIRSRRNEGTHKALVGNPLSRFSQTAEDMRKIVNRSEVSNRAALPKSPNRRRPEIERYIAHVN